MELTVPHLNDTPAHAKSLNFQHQFSYKMDQNSNGMQNTRILALSQMIASQTALINKHLQDNNHPEPSFAADGPIEAIREPTPEVEKAKNAIIEATIELRQLLEGPVKALVPEVSKLPLFIRGRKATR
jgi:hypothetical protein